MCVRACACACHHEGLEGLLELRVLPVKGVVAPLLLRRQVLLPRAERESQVLPRCGGRPSPKVWGAEGPKHF
jgi:hypothetical protein